MGNVILFVGTERLFFLLCFEFSQVRLIYMFYYHDIENCSKLFFLNMHLLVLFPSMVKR